MRTKEIAAYVRNNVEFYEERLQLALNRMDRMRCPLWMAFPILYDEICEVLSDNDIEIDEIDIEEIISA